MVRPLDGAELIRVKALVDAQVPFALVEPTATGLAKSILDAIAPLRDLLRQHQIHDFDHQGQGQENKRVVPAYFLFGDRSIQSRASLYRPNTKQGDPRIWFSRLGEYAQAHSVIAVIPFSESLYVINLSSIDPNAEMTLHPSGDLASLLREWSRDGERVSSELLAALRDIARSGPLRAIKRGSTAIGMTIEAALGIAPNSSKTPDYKGIELKSGRIPKLASRATRKTLFAQVPNWERSNLGSSAAILDRYGYDRAGVRKLYCTISGLGPNSQGLYFNVMLEADQLAEMSAADGMVAIWDGVKLRERLVEKHRETFWIAADTIYDGGDERFVLKHVIHTRRPAENLFLTLVAQGLVTMDHLIKRSAGRVTEKGPLFKIEPNGIGLLFPSNNKYDL